MSERARFLTIAAAFVAVLLIVGFVLAGGATASAALQEDNDSTGWNGSDSPDHVHPDDAGDGDEGTSGWLEQRLGGMLSDGAVQIDEGEYDLAREYVGDDYQERLEQYVEVTGNTEAGEQYRDAGETQQEVAELLEEYQTALGDYETAQANGNETRARELARELATLSTEIEAKGVELERTFHVLNESSPGNNFGETSDNVNETVIRIENTTDQVVQESFVATELSVSAARERISFRDPLSIDGRLTAENGTPIANATIAVTDPSEPTITTTDAEGRFSVDHRPILLPANASALTVKYRPETASSYAGADASVPVDVEQAEASLAVTRSETSSGEEPFTFGESTPVNVTAVVDGEGLGGIPVRATVDGSRDDAVTDSNGHASPEPAIDADVATGDRPVQVAVPLENRAVAFEPSELTVAVDETATTLSITTTENGSGSVTASGTLETADGLPASNVSIAITVDGSPATTVSTDDAGEYEAALSAVEGDGPVTVTANFDGGGSTLQSARANASVTVTAAESGGDGILGGNALLVGGMIAGIALLGGVGWLAQRRDQSEADGDAPEAPATPATHSEEADPDPAAAVEDARRYLETDPVSATTLAYGAARSSLSDHVPTSDTGTHREFLAACAANGLNDDTVAALRTLTDRYEAAVFDPSGVDSEAAREALAAADRVA